MNISIPMVKKRPQRVIVLQLVYFTNVVLSYFVLSYNFQFVVFTQ